MPTLAELVNSKHNSADEAIDSELTFRYVNRAEFSRMRRKHDLR
jgi:hypothetical protein